MNELALFAGAGGGVLGSRLLGWKTVCAVEINPYCREVLLRRQEEGHLEPFPIWDDAKTFKGKPWRSKVDIVTFGDPCQDASCAFTSGAHHDYGIPLADVALRIVTEVQPVYVLRENPWPVRKTAVWPPDRISKALSDLGYSTLPVSIRACCLGFDHRRWRMFVPAILADSAGIMRRAGEEEAKNPEVNGRQPSNSPRRSAEPGVGRVAYGVANRMDRLRALGEGQVPAVVRAAGQLLSGVK